MSDAITFPPSLNDIIEDFSLLEGQEKLEYLLELAENLPPLPERFAARRAEFADVHECMSPVALVAEQAEDGIFYYFDVPREAPTARGFAAVLAGGLNGSPAATIAAIPFDLYRNLTLQTVLTHQRLNGFTAILAQMKRLAVDLAGAPPAD